MRSSETPECINGLEPEKLTRIMAALNDAIKAIADALAGIVRTTVRLVRKLAKCLDPRWKRRYRRALARSRRNNLHLKSIGRCR